MKYNTTQRQIQDLINSHAAKLTKDELLILELRWGLKTGNMIQISEVSKLTGQTKKFVAQTEKSALIKLKAINGAE